MLKTLIKKQFMESFRSYFVNNKTGKARSTGGMIGLFVLFAVLMLYLSGMFFGLAFMVGGPLFGTSTEWMYFTVMGALAIMLGTFGSVFNTYSSLYIARDNELLLSMPIPASVILTSRLALVYGLGILYTSIVWIPTCMYYWIAARPGFAAVLFDILLLFIITAFVSVLTCALGWVMAMVSGKLKNKSIVIVIIALVFFAFYYYVCLNLTNVIQSLIDNAAEVGGVIKVWGYILYSLSAAATGNIVQMLIFTAITAALSFITVYILVKSFFWIVTRTSGTKKAERKTVSMSQTSVKKALLNKELKRFTSSSTYMLNAGLGIAILPVVGILALINSDSMRFSLEMIQEILGKSGDYAVLIVAVCVSVIAGMNFISCPSVSLEGKNLWILKSLPVNPADIIDAKLNLHVYLNIVPAVIGAVLFSMAFGISTSSMMFAVVYPMAYIWFTGALGLVLGLLRPNFNWTNEAYVLKQSLNTIIMMLAGIIIPIITIAVFFLIKSELDADYYVLGCAMVFAVLGSLMTRWLRTKGADLFAKL